MGERNHTVRIWQANDGKCILTLKGHDSSVRSVAFAPDGNTLASASDDNTVRIWDVETGELVATLVNLDEGGAVIWPNGRYSMQGEYAGEFWWTIGLCRFEPGELDPYVEGFQRV